MLAAVDPSIVVLSAITVLATIFMGFWASRKSKSAADFFVAGRGVSVGWNASAISGEYLSAASFMGVAGMVMSSGYDALWYPVCYACGYLFLLLFIAGPLRRFGAYTIPDFAEGRYDSPLFRKIAVIFVLFIGIFYTMPQMKGAGTTLAYIFEGLPYWVGVVLVGAVITFNVALGGMKGITMVQAFQYWLKMFAISVPVFVLMMVYGSYGRQLEVQGESGGEKVTAALDADPELVRRIQPVVGGGRRVQLGATPGGALNTTAQFLLSSYDALVPREITPWRQAYPSSTKETVMILMPVPFSVYQRVTGRRTFWDTNLASIDAIEVDMRYTTNTPDAEIVSRLEKALLQKHVTLVAGPKNSTVALSTADAERLFAAPNGSVLRAPLPAKAAADATWLNPFGPLTSMAAKAAKIEGEAARPYALLYTYSLIIALVCGTAGLPHILVRFYTNPDGAAAKRTTMWVMILIGIFYVFPPVFGVLGRNLMPDLYTGLTGVKGTDAVVLKLPTILKARYGVLGSILSGVACAGAFAAFMSTFSGLLVSMTGALAHDVYGRILCPKSTATERMQMFKWCAMVVGGVAVLFGCFVEKLEINFMVGQAFAIAAASYFPLLFMSVWWRGMTMRGAATGMLTGGCCSLVAVALTNASSLATDPGAMGRLFAGFKPLNEFWAHHPLLRILCEQPAIWCVPLAILLMVIVSKLTRAAIPKDIRMKMLVLHAPEQLGLKQDYIKEHEGPAH